MVPISCDLTGVPNGLLQWASITDGLSIFYDNNTIVRNSSNALTVGYNSTRSTLTLTNVTQNTIYVCNLMDPITQMPYIAGLYSICLSN